MEFFKKILAFLESIFNRSSPEVQKRLRKKKMENELAKMSPVLCRNGNITANFAEAMYLLYKHTKLLDNLFLETIGGTDISRQARFRMQLVLTGFSLDEQQDIEFLSYESRKKDVLEESGDIGEKRTYDYQRQRLERIISSLNTDAFKVMDKNLMDLHQFADLCHFNFVTLLQKFDPNFQASDASYKPTYREVPLGEIGRTIDELYYQIGDLRVTNAVGNAIAALVKLKYGSSISKEQNDAYLEDTKKIASILSRIIPMDHLKAILRLYKEDAGYEPKKVSYRESARQEFSMRLQTQFKADEQRIKTEIKDSKIQAELYSLFGTTALSTITGYNSAMNEKLHANSQLTLTSIMPLQILKTFLQIYVSPKIKSVLNDIVVEGFFTNQSFKTDFAGIVYTALECIDRVDEFEKTFERNEPNDISLLESYMNDSRKDSGFYKKMEKMVESINRQAQSVIQNEISALQAFYSILSEILADIKKPSSELIQNLKVLMLSPRNREMTDLLVSQFPNWRVFFEIMRNYTVVTIKEN